VLGLKKRIRNKQLKNQSLIRFWNKRRIKMKEIDLFSGSKHYRKFVESFCERKSKVNFDLNKNNITKAIYYHLYLINYAGWNMRIKFNRKIKHNSSEIWQDIIAFYLSKALGNNYQVALEEKKDKIRPDILIRNKNKNIFVIEVKTTIGWSRINNKNILEKKKEISQRIRDISNKFNVNKKNIIYIFGSPKNNSKDFWCHYWDDVNKKKKLNCTKFPYNCIYPLFFNGPDPYYFPYEKGFKKKESIKPMMKKSEILKEADKNIIFTLEEIISLIKKCK
jgi:hypothetical protein